MFNLYSSCRKNIVINLPNICATEANKESMWTLVEKLFPIHRSLVGPGYSKSLRIIEKILKLKITKFPSDTEVLGWKVPKSFSVNESYVIDPDGKKIFDFLDNHYHVLPHSQSFKGKLKKKELLKNISVHPILRDAVPLKPTYYRKKWGIAASQRQVEKLKEGDYKVNIDVNNKKGNLEIGEKVIKGKFKKEILISSYLCHPHGANDNLSGIAVVTELFKILSKHKLNFTYRLAIWPETIGSICFIKKNQNKLKNILAAFSCMIVGDKSPFLYKKTINGNGLVDRVFEHTLKNSGVKYDIEDYFHDGSDERQFNCKGVNVPYGLISRGYTRYKEYHTSLDNLKYINSDNLYQTLKLILKVIETFERSLIFEPKWKVEPFLTKYGIYPFDLGSGEGYRTSREAQTFYDLMGFVDGRKNLLDISNTLNLPIQKFDRAIGDYLKAKLVKVKEY